MLKLKGCACQIRSLKISLVLTYCDEKLRHSMAILNPDKGKGFFGSKVGECDVDERAVHLILPKQLLLDKGAMTFFPDNHHS